MTALQALIGFAAWTLLLVTAVFLYRGVRHLQGTPINHWPRKAKPADDAVVIQRMEDAHANCLENLPVFAVLVLAAAALGKLDAIADIAPWALYARIAQSLVHLTGTGRLQVLVRATFWAVQLVVFYLILIKLL